MTTFEQERAGFRLFHIPCKAHTWIEADAAQRVNIAASGRAEFITALDVDMTDPNPEAWQYAGDFYIDFDSADIGTTTGKVREFLTFLRDRKGLDLDQVRIYASGKKGFHVEIPLACLMLQPKPLQRLPAVFKELAFSLYHDTIDLAVYTAKKGRMWRVPNFQRPDGGTYKVQITLDELMAMTPTTYSAIVAQPRPLFETKTGTLCSALALAFNAAAAKVAASARRKPEQDRAAAALQHRCKASGYVLPPSLLMLATGRTPARDGIGFNQVALQLAIAARDLALSADDLVKLCRGLITSHASDSSRYASSYRRETELRRQYAYVADNPSYIFSVGAVRAILPAAARCPDLRGL